MGSETGKTRHGVLGATPGSKFCSHKMALGDNKIVETIRKPIVNQTFLEVIFFPE